MTDQTENLLQQILRRIQTEAADTRERISGLETRLSAIDSHLVALQLGINANTGELLQFRTRLERIERRLELREDQS